jgi:hypothetical protein
MAPRHVGRRNCLRELLWCLLVRRDFRNSDLSRDSLRSHMPVHGSTSRMATIRTETAAEGPTKDCYKVKAASTKHYEARHEKLRIAGAERTLHESGRRVRSHVGPPCRRI